MLKNIPIDKPNLKFVPNEDKNIDKISKEVSDRIIQESRNKPPEAAPVVENKEEMPVDDDKTNDNPSAGAEDEPINADPQMTAQPMNNDV